MEARDLMIGDYVQMKVLRMNKVFEKEAVMMPYKVIEVRDRLVLERINIIDDNDRYTIISSSYIVEPIPLTKKILEKNGFVEKEFYSELIVGDFRILCDINNVCVYHNEHVDLDIPIKYLHELQHAMRICCISKQIEL